MMYLKIRRKVVLITIHSLKHTGIVTNFSLNFGPRQIESNIRQILFQYKFFDIQSKGDHIYKTIITMCNFAVLGRSDGFSSVWKRCNTTSVELVFTVVIFNIQFHNDTS